jgi:hypothetical protein
MILEPTNHCREDLVRELAATVGEKQVLKSLAMKLGQQLTSLSLKYEADQSHMEQKGPFTDIVRKGDLDELVNALTERDRSVHTLADLQWKAIDADALAARFRIFPEETAAAIMEVKDDHVPETPLNWDDSG